METEAATESPEIIVAESGLTRLSAQEALEKLRAGETLRDVEIRSLNFTGEFDKPIKMIHVTLIRPSFTKCTIKESIELFNCTLINPSIQKKTTFENIVNFSGSTIRNLNFRDATVMDNFSLENAELEGFARFHRSTFEGKFRVWNSRFHGWFELQSCEFFSELDLRSFHADEGFSMERSHCHGDALFRGASVTKKFTLDGTTFDGALDLSKAKLHDFAYLQGIQQGEKQHFAFANTVSERIMVYPSQLEGRLKSVQDGDFETAMLEYGLLKRCCSSLHQYDDEDRAFYNFKVCQRKAKSRSWLQPWTKVAEWADILFLDWGCGYGTNPFRAIGAALIIMFLFMLVYTAGYNNFVIETPLVPQFEKAHVVNRIVYAGMTSVSVFTAGFTGDHLVSAQGWVLVPLAIEALMGTLLWGLFIVAFSRKVIR